MLMSAKEFRETAFTPNSRPTMATIKCWIRTGKLAGKQIGRLYFVVTEDTLPANEPITTEPDFSRYVPKQA